MAKSSVVPPVQEREASLPQQRQDPAPRDSDDRRGSRKSNVENVSPPLNGPSRKLEGCTFADLPLKPDSPLAKRCGITRYLKLRELMDPPGMVLHLNDSSLSMEEGFANRLRYVKDFDHHKVKPWIEKAMTQRAEAWLKLDLTDLKRVTGKVFFGNRTIRPHRGQAWSAATRVMDTAASLQKKRNSILLTRWRDQLGPSLAPQLAGHLDGMRPEDVHVVTETRKSSSTGQELLFCIWVGVNAPYRLASLSFEQRPLHPDVDTFAPVMTNFSRWLRSTWNSREALRPGRDPLNTGQRHDPSLRFRDLVPEGHTVPVVVAWRQKYIWFTWEGGIQGKLVAQYASHWLPHRDVDRVGDPDTKIKSIQMRLLRELETVSDQCQRTAPTNRHGDARHPGED